MPGAGLASRVGQPDLLALLPPLDLLDVDRAKLKAVGSGPGACSHKAPRGEAWGSRHGEGWGQAVCHPGRRAEAGVGVTCLW